MKGAGIHSGYRGFHSFRRTFALRSEVAAFQNGESDNILDFVSVDEYRKMEDELKKAYQYFEWNDRSGAYRYYEEIQKKVAAQVKDTYLSVDKGQHGSYLPIQMEPDTVIYFYPW